ncbi:hypothetical protein QDR37_02670 [Amnibacterium sp. CER49]|uniref:hypothetical protein n=1 Tax=Amnibacterium sp. CER49 TaxID=3039161 RepID=UPI0024474589|nr:hypothetical protein [Amnibacterium sp. CER49]MDH2442842.1 hypothetical protein [Amnibacterium sp. CER49]
MLEQTDRTAAEGTRIPVLDPLAARPWIPLVVVAATVLAAHLGTRDWSWHYIARGVRTLFSPVGLHLYALHPELQMGPLTFALGALFVIVLKGAVGSVAADAVMMVVGLLAVREIRTLIDVSDACARRRWFLASGLVLVAWSEVAVHWAHLDDAMALLLGVVGVRLARSERFLPAGLVLALAIGFKPWAVPFVAVLLLADRRRLLAALGMLGGLSVLIWGPFLLADPSSVGAGRFGIHVEAASTIHLLHLAHGTTPAWCRPAQLLGGLLLAGLAVRRGRWPAVLLVVIALRMLIDPAAKNYYDSGLILGAALFDAAGATAAVPMLTLIAFLGVYLPSYLLAGTPTLQAIVRTAALIVPLVLGLVAPSATAPHASPRPEEKPLMRDATTVKV